MSFPRSEQNIIQDMKDLRLNVNPERSISLLSFILLCSIWAPVLSLAGTVEGNPPGAKVEEKSSSCMTCHRSRDLFTVFKDSERMSVFVQAADFHNTVHSMLNCRDCHQKISNETHPARILESRKTFLRDVSAECRRCHPDEKLKAKPNHSFAAEREFAPPCVDCHGGHGVKRIGSLKQGLKENDYCLVCHRQKISKTLESGEVLSLLIDPANLGASVHNSHACRDCHTEFSKDSHPVQVYANSREHSVVASGACRKCHEDKFALLGGSIHYTMHFQWGESMINAGNMRVPVCTDCHGFHTVGPKETYETLSGAPCRKCHEDIFRLYAMSVHGLAKERGEHKAPICSTCHFAHEAGFTALTAKMKTACLRCHKDAESAHKKWLPNAELHLTMIACAACHAPASGKGIFLQLYDEKSGKLFTEDEILSLLGTSHEELSGRLNAHGEGIDSHELSYIIRQLRDKGSNANLTFIGKMDVRKYSEAHELSMKKHAVRECESCHQKGSQFFKNVTVAIIKADGDMAQYGAKPDILDSLRSTRLLRQFYVLGSMRLSVLDWVGIVIVLGGVAVPIVHIFARLATLPLRKGTRQNSRRKGE